MHSRIFRGFLLLAKKCTVYYNTTMRCNLCPRNCNIERSASLGVCGTHGALISRVGKHMWEEPCISGDKGSGTVFFAGCNLKCRFCQNFDITASPHGAEVSPARLADVFLWLQDTGVANINLVTASHVLPIVVQALKMAKPRLFVPVVYNTSSYEKVDALQTLEGLVDVYLPDLKFCSADLAQKMCHASNYFEVATAAIAEMKHQQPHNVFDNGYIQKGLIIRHLVLPAQVEDSKRVLDWIASFDKSSAVSVMSQYFPAKDDLEFPQLNRRLFRHEYDAVCDYFFNVGLTNGYMQELSSATADYLPDFDDSLVEKLLRSVPKVFDMTSS